jgi:cbb3-type cytochrome oxidase cytochrome c subunit
MTFKSFILGLLATFTLPWVLVVIVPFATMQGLAPVEFNEDDDGQEGVYVPARPGRVTDGSRVYATNGCYVCHTQLIRPTYAGSDVWREDWAGVVDPTAIPPKDTRRETTVYDYSGEPFAQIGLTRTGPDLSNVGRRVESYVKETEGTPEQWFLMHLYNPRAGYEYWSACPSNPQLFVERPKRGQGSADALPVDAGESVEIVATAEARALASYLISLQKDDKVPFSLNYRADKKRAIEQ